MKIKLQPTKITFVSFFIAAAFAATVFYSCDYSYFDEIEDVDYTYRSVFVLPLVNSSLTIYDLIDTEESSSIEYDDDLIRLVYKGQVFSLEASELFVVENQSSGFSFSFSPAPKNSNKNIVNVIEETFPFIYDGEERIDEILFEKADFWLNVQADTLIQDGYDLRIEMMIPDSDDGYGNNFYEEFLLQDDPIKFNLDGYTLIFETNDDGDNFFNINYAITIESYGEPNNFPYELTFEQEIYNIQYIELIGYIDNYFFPVGFEDIGLGLYDNSVLSDIFFKNPFINVYANNSFGLPLYIHFKSFEFYNEIGDTVNLSGYGFDNNNPWFINIPDVMGDSALTHEHLNRENINIDEILAISPKEALYEVRGEANPDADADITNFIRHDSRFNVDVEINLPLHGNVKRYRINDTIDFGIDEIDEKIDWVEFNVLVNNGFPIDLYLQAYFIDETDFVLDSLFIDDYVQVFKSAKVDGDGNIIEPTPKEKIITIERDKIENISGVDRIVLSFGINTKQNPDSTKDDDDPFSVKIYNYHVVDVNVGVTVGLAYELN